MHSFEIHLRSDLKLFRSAALVLAVVCVALFFGGLWLDWGEVTLLGISLSGLSLYHAFLWLRRFLQLRRFLKSLRRSPLATNHSSLFL